jgi:hypothetical protein
VGRWNRFATFLIGRRAFWKRRGRNFRAGSQDFNYFGADIGDHRKPHVSSMDCMKDAMEIHFCICQQNTSMDVFIPDH